MDDDNSFDSRLLDWRQLESEAMDAERDLDCSGKGIDDARWRERQGLADQRRASANAALRRLIQSVECESGRP